MIVSPISQWASVEKRAVIADSFSRSLRKTQKRNGATIAKRNIGNGKTEKGSARKRLDSTYGEKSEIIKTSVDIQHFLPSFFLLLVKSWLVFPVYQGIITEKEKKCKGGQKAVFMKIIGIPTRLCATGRMSRSCRVF